MHNSNRIDGKRQRVKTILATALMFVTAALLMVPFYFMFLSSLKPGTEMLRNGLSLTFDPGVSSFKNYEALNTSARCVFPTPGGPMKAMFFPS